MINFDIKDRWSGRVMFNKAWDVSSLFVQQLNGWTALHRRIWQAMLSAI